MDDDQVTAPDRSGSLERKPKARTACLDCARNRTQLVNLARDVTGITALLDQIDTDRREMRFRVLFLEGLVIGLGVVWLLRRQADTIGGGHGA